MSFNIFSGRIPHGIILESSDLKKAYDEAIKAVAKLFCSVKNENSCGKCSSCIKLKKGIHPDLKTVSPLSNSKTIKVEQIRLIRQDAYIIPNESDYKVYIFSPAEALTVQAQNAFIKILEEPPKNVVFILICKSTELLLDTVLSRCEVFRLKDGEVSGGEIEEKSQEILDLSFAGKKIEALKILAQMPADRESFKTLICMIMRGIMGKIKDSELPADEGIKKIEKLRVISDFLERNVNLNLIVSCLSAEL